LIAEKMDAIFGVVVDNCVLITTLFVILVSIFAAMILWRRKPQASGGQAAVDEFLVEDTQPRSKKTVKSKPKKTKSDKVFCSVPARYYTQINSLFFLLICRNAVGLGLG